MKTIKIALLSTLLTAGFALSGHAAIIGPGDGSDEPGFVAPPADAMKPPAPPAHIASAETLIPYPGPPVFPSRARKRRCRRRRR